MIWVLAAWADPPVVGGVPSPAGRWPDVAAVGILETENCTGTLIAPDWVLTAGHCLPFVSHVILGATDYELDGERFEVVEEVLHPDPSITYDVALVRLDRPATLPPRPLVQGCLSAFYVDGMPFTVAGFGRLNAANTTDTTVLHEAVVNAVDADCSSPGRDCHPRVAPGGELIAGGEGVDSCAGDSGGPLYLDLGEQGAFHAGVVSRGVLPFDLPCGDGGIYVRTDAIIPWIRSTTGLPFVEPSCATVNLPPQVEADPLILAQGSSAELPLRITDGNPEDTHRIEVLTPLAMGSLRGTTYRAEPFQLGRQLLRLRITDDGVPARSAEVEIPIEVVPAGVLEPLVPGGCATSTPGSGWLALLGLALARRRVQLTSQTSSA